ncbi:MAG: transcriptional regulator [Lamprobacter sp.]|uniref:flagellar transcriptional regulator FlhD n=1 Tax=Lamprobacter sp. TaxID=3100796 RepID=UPI002B260271|nr:flagellar transcriptional regulator FlhD [Lamprobacter sp.]MEA3643657.1 transcriptional regulator [Lamprobacter sp.]
MPDMTTPDTQPETGLDREVITLNLHCLLSAQALARSDAQKASLIYGLDRTLMGLLREASFPVLRALAESGVLHFRPRFESRLLEERFVAASASTLALDLQAVLLAAEEVERS